MKKPDIKICGIEEIPDLCLLAQEFNAETDWGLTYDDEIAITQLYGFITQDRSDVIAAYLDGDIAGGAIVVAAQDLSRETLGFMHKFYVRKKFRTSLAPLFLTKAAAEWFDSHGCVLSFVTDTGGVGGVICAFKRLMGKYGYSPTGPTLFRRLNG